MPYCAKYGFDAAKRKARLAELGLTADDLRLAARLQRQVIGPNVDAILDELHGFLNAQPGFRQVIARGFDPARLRAAQRDYLLTFGVRIDSASYFGQRLHLGHVHARTAVPLSLHQMACALLQRLILKHIPPDVQRDPAAYAALVAVLLKVGALDMSLAIESYHQDELHQIESSLSRLRSEASELQRLAALDSFTGLLNHHALIEALRRALAATDEEREELCVIMADLDWFKTVNDTRGHPAGDRVLRGVAARLRAAARDADVVGRYGGDEFVVILADTSLPIAYQIAERIRTHVGGAPLQIDGNPAPVTISLGVARARDRGDDAESLIARADVALYKAKAIGRNCTVASFSDEEWKSPVACAVHAGRHG